MNACRSIRYLLLLQVALLLSGCADQPVISLKSECLLTMRELADALLTRQNLDPDDPDFGGLHCALCDVYHTRAAEALYPLAVAFKHSGEEKEKYDSPFPALSAFPILLVVHKPDSAFQAHIVYRLALDGE